MITLPPSAFSLLLPWLATSAAAQERLPILDIHLHAVAADHHGPPPVAMCTPMEFPAWDPKEAYDQTFVAMHNKPRCPDPVWSPMTDDELMNQTIEVMDRLNIVGVLSGPEPDRIATWIAAAPERFIPGLILEFSEAGADFSTDSLRTLHGAGRLAVLAGFGDRVMFGSDQIVWPGVIERAVAVIEEAPFVNEEQKRDIFYNNAARFLQLSEEEIARHLGLAARPGPEFDFTPTAAGEPRRASQPAGDIPDDGTRVWMEVEPSNRRSSMVMTVLEARVAPERWEALQASYGERARLSEEGPIVESFLVQADDDPDTWRIVTVWRDRESLEAMRASGETPTGELIFRDADAEPQLSVFTVFANPRATAGARP